MRITGFLSVRQYFNRESTDPLLNQMDSPGFTWRTKNFLWDELKVLRRNSFVKSKNTIDDYRFKSSMLG